MPSFDVVSKLDNHELDNAVQQASREVGTRYDFRNTDTEIERNDEGILLRANSEGRLEAALEVLRSKCAKRQVSLKSLEPQRSEPGSRGNFKQLIKLREGIDTDRAKSMVKFVKDQKLKVQAAIQGDQLRITGKKRDDLQATIQSLKSEDFDIELQFINFRD